ncbi:hypothetical protein I6F53_05865 [Pseudoalteromonas sp. SWN29]|uniref:hypothetical protein n=1 Tax=Pseudoalteromonas sp. SWN29 TaxID=2792064 RepID=UPI0018CDD9CC|nr:hypothetical protein [Pseudoalteromonas sp. SWN29]MBH0026504.1 hypothetical protein [Pseudoalteromonas sp. SWN29]
MFQMLVICLFIWSIFSFMKSVSIFIATWKTEAPMHWRVWNEPEFIDLYRQMFTYLWPVVFGKACEDANSDLLVKKRNDIRFTLIISVLLFIAGTAFNGLSFEVSPRWVS